MLTSYTTISVPGVFIKKQLLQTQKGHLNLNTEIREGEFSRTSEIWREAWSSFSLQFSEKNIPVGCWCQTSRFQKSKENSSLSQYPKPTNTKSVIPSCIFHHTRIRKSSWCLHCGVEGRAWPETPTSQMATGSSPGCSISHVAPCYWPGKSSRKWPNCLCSYPSRETWRKLLDSVLSLVQAWSIGKWTSRCIISFPALVSLRLSIILILIKLNIYLYVCI